MRYMLLVHVKTHWGTWNMWLLNCTEVMRPTLPVTALEMTQVASMFPDTVAHNVHLQSFGSCLNRTGQGFRLQQRHSGPKRRLLIDRWRSTTDCSYSNISLLLADTFPTFPQGYITLTQGDRSCKAQQKNKIHMEICGGLLECMSENKWNTLF